MSKNDVLFDILQVFILSLCLVILVVVGFAYSSIRYYRRKCKPLSIVNMMSYVMVSINLNLDEARDAHLGFSKTRFRKRDRFMFYGRKVLRQVTSAAGSNRRKKIITKITKKLLKLKTDTPPTRLHVSKLFFSLGLNVDYGIFKIHWLQIPNRYWSLPQNTFKRR